VKSILHLLREGFDGVEQPPAVKRALRALERDGLAKYAAGGWRLTERGRKLLAGDADADHGKDAVYCSCKDGSPSFDLLSRGCGKCGLPVRTTRRK